MEYLQQIGRVNFITCLFATVSTIHKERETVEKYDNNLIAEKHGLGANAAGAVSVTNEYIILPILINLPYYDHIFNITRQPQFMLKHSSCSGIQISFKQRKTIRTSAQIDFSHKFSALLDSLQSKIDRYIDSRKETLRPLLYGNNSQLDNRSKRSLLGIFGAGTGLLSLILGGMSQYQIHQINSHVDKNRDYIAQMELLIQSQQKEITILKNDVAGFSKRLTDAISTQLQIQTCQDFLNDISLQFQIKFNQYKTILDDILWSPLSGKNSLLLSPKMIDIESLKTIITTHTELYQTIFNEQPAFLYSTAQLTLLKIDTRLSLAHFVLYVPWIKTSNRLLKLYKTSQVGTYLTDNSCRYLDIPPYMVQSKDILFDIDLQLCKSHLNLYICPTEAKSTAPSCLQRTNSTCHSRRSQCKGHYEFATSLHGTLIRNNKISNTILRNNTGWSSIAKFNIYRTAYFPWENISSIQTGYTKLTSPNAIAQPIQAIDFDLDYSQEFIDSNEVSSVFTNICNEFNASLKDFLYPIAETFHGSYSKSSTYSCISIFDIIMCTCLSAVIIYLAVIHFRNTTRSTPEKKTLQPREPINNLYPALPTINTFYNAPNYQNSDDIPTAERNRSNSF